MPDPDFDIGGKALLKRYNSVPAPDPDLEIRGRGGGGWGQEAVCKNTFSALGASVWSQNQEGGGGGRVTRAPPLDPPLYFKSS